MLCLFEAIWMKSHSLARTCSSKNSSNETPSWSIFHFILQAHLSVEKLVDNQIELRGYESISEMSDGLLNPQRPFRNSREFMQFRNFSKLNLSDQLIELFLSNNILSTINNTPLRLSRNPYWWTRIVFIDIFYPLNEDDDCSKGIHPMSWYDLSSQSSHIVHKPFGREASIYEMDIRKRKQIRSS